MEIKLLPAERLDELNEIYDMRRYEGFQETRRRNLESCKEICVAAEENGKFVGELSIMTENANIPAAVVPGKRVYIFGLRVLPAYQNQGVGTSLVRYAVSFCAQRGVFEFTIGVETKNKRARRLYERLGFVDFLDNCSEVHFGEVCKFDLLLLKLR